MIIIIALGVGLEDRERERLAGPVVADLSCYII